MPLKVGLLSFFVLWGLFLGLVWLPIEQIFPYFCFNNFDLGIYAQALHQLSWTTPNPWLSVREVFLFNDHFDPILFALVPLKGLAHPAQILIRVEMVAVLLATIPFFLLARQGRLSYPAALFAAAFLMFSLPMTRALYYPAHPGSWAIAPLSFSCYFLVMGRLTPALLCFSVTLFCKEEFPVAGLALASGLFWLRRWSEGFKFLFLSIFWGILAFGLRPLLIGPAPQYTGELMTGQGLMALFGGDALRQLAGILGAFAAPFGLLWFWVRKQLTWREPDFRLFGLLFLTMFAVRFVGGWWANHRSAPLLVPFLFLSLPLLRAGGGLSSKRWALLFFLLFAWSWNPLQKAAKTWVGTSWKAHCPLQEDRKKNLSAAVNYLLQHSDGKALVQGHLLPALVERDELSHLGASSVPEGEVRYLLVEKMPLGNPWPWNEAELSQALERWRGHPEVELVLENEHALLLKRKEMSSPSNATDPRNP
jgi:hypothetical protein